MRNKVHYLKTWPVYYNAVHLDQKSFEVRKNDSDFVVGDMVVLEEWAPNNDKDLSEGGEYTGRKLFRRISYIMNGGSFGLEKGNVILSLKKV